jgi:hypothetical protein
MKTFTLPPQSLFKSVSPTCRLYGIFSPLQTYPTYTHTQVLATSSIPMSLALPSSAPGLSSEITKIRKKNAPSISFAPPSHVDRVIPKKPRPKEPVTKKGKREAREREREDRETRR